LQATVEDPRLVWAYNDGLRLAPLPVLAAANDAQWAVLFFRNSWILHSRCNMPLRRGMFKCST